MDTNQNQQNSIEKYRVDGMSLKNKSDKITAALHMVTDCIEDNEPIRFRLRTLAVELASDVHALIHAPSRDRGFIFSDLELLATEIMSFLSIARSIRMISDMNADILLRELTTNTERMRTWTETGFYESEEAGPAVTPIAFSLNEGHFKTEQKFSSDSQTNLPVKIAKPVQEISHHKGHMEQLKEKNIKKTVAEDSRKFEFAMKLNRRNAILKIIKDKKEVTIKDISLIIADCSEKTIQRELINLVSEGVLKKVGEKRWSKYMLA
jgi:hypothetical protein